MRQTYFLKTLLALGVAALASCGGSGGQSANGSGLTAVKVFGDSLSDSGAIQGVPVAAGGIGSGRVFSVQDSSTQIWTERLADLVGAAIPCNFFVIVTPTTPDFSCGSFAVGGGRVNNRYFPQTDPGKRFAPAFSIPTQIATAASLGNYKATDLVLIDGGANDAADLVGAYLKPAADPGLSFSDVVTSAQAPGFATPISQALGQGAAGLPTAGVLYMQALADELYTSIKTNVLDKGATHVVLLNAPAITKTPRFQMVLGGVERAQGQATRMAVEAVFEGWVQAFNARLAEKVNGDSRVVLVDFYTAFLDQYNNPSQFGLTNVTTPACPATPAAAGATDPLPTYNFETCTAASLSASNPSNPDWWKTYAFSDGFHPTPYGYQLLSQLVARSLAQAGWIK